VKYSLVARLSEVPRHGFNSANRYFEVTFDKVFVLDKDIASVDAPLPLAPREINIKG